MGSSNDQRPFLDNTAASDNAVLLTNEDLSRFVMNPENYTFDDLIDPNMFASESSGSQNAQGPSQSHTAAAVQQHPEPASPSQFFVDAYHSRESRSSEPRPTDNVPDVLPAAQPAEVSPEVAAALATAYPPIDKLLTAANNPYPAASAAGNAGARLAPVDNTRGSGMDNMGQAQAYAYNGLGGLGLPQATGNWQQQSWNGQSHQVQVQDNGVPSNQYNNVQSRQSQAPQGISGPSEYYIQAQMSQQIGHPNQQYVDQSQRVQDNSSPSMRVARQSRNAPVTPHRSTAQESDYEKPVKVSHKRRDKVPGNEKTNADRVYVNRVPVPTNWEAVLPGGQKSLFTYAPEGQFRSQKVLTTEELQAYFEQCPRAPRLWVQQCPSQSNHRTRKEDRQCRWARCPILAKTLTSGWLRVAFDEYPKLTSDGTKDPFHIAGSMHLWCFEQCFDPLEYHMKGMLHLDRRELLKEEKNPMSVSRDTDNAINKEWLAWKNEQETQAIIYGKPAMPRPHESSLSYCLVTHHLRNQPDARKQVRDVRNGKRNQAFLKTADCHKGDLQYFVNQGNAERERKRRAKQVATGPNMAAVNNDVFRDSVVCTGSEDANGGIDLLPLHRYLHAPANQSRAQFAPEGSSARRGQKRPRNDAEHNDLFSDDDEDDGDDSLFGFPRRPKRARIEKGGGGQRQFELTMTRSRRHPRRRRSYSCGDEPSRFRRGSL